MKRTCTFLLATAFAAMTAAAQEATDSRMEETESRVATLESDLAKLKKIKLSGYIQVQNQWGQENASLKVGSGNENPGKDSFNRFGVRRGRIKFTFEEGIASAVFQLDVTDKGGVGFKDAYLNIKDPWIGTMALRGGVFDRPFGYEISYSSSRRESPERSTVFQNLFPDERDLGAMLVLQPAKTSPWNILKLEGGLFAGNGIKAETDSRKDFIGHFSILKPWTNVSLGGGVSYYNGGVFQTTANVYTMDGTGFILSDEESNKGKYAKREYVGLDAELTVTSVIGMTKLNGEYLFGTQPGTAGSTKSPNYSTLPSPGTDTYIRKFSGGYVMLVQYIAKTPLGLVAKYDWYDPNTKVSEDEIGLAGTGTSKADLAQSTIGFGALVNFNPNMRLTAYYEINSNEKSAGVAGYEDDRKDNVFTLRLQYKF